MTNSNQELIESFLNGEKPSTIPDAARMKVEEVNGNPAIIGYGWAVYAENPEGEPVQIYEGWRGYSSQTSGHLNLIHDIAFKSGREGVKSSEKNNGRKRLAEQYICPDKPQV